MDIQELQDLLLAHAAAGERIGLITDIDGTISPIASVPDAAVVSSRSRSALAALCERFALVAALSGRSALDSYNMVGLDCMVYIGNHGFDRWRAGITSLLPAAEVARPLLEAVRDTVQPLLLSGMFVEDKGATLSIHYRNALDTDVAHDYMKPILDRLVEEYQLTCFKGRMVFEIRPLVHIHKGTALDHLVSDYELKAVVFLGDDTTDADAMVTLRRMRETAVCEAYSIGVLSDETPAIIYESADVMVAGVSGVEDWLEMLAAAFNISPTAHR